MANIQTDAQGNIVGGQGTPAPTTTSTAIPMSGGYVAPSSITSTSITPQAPITPAVPPAPTTPNTAGTGATIASNAATNTYTGPTGAVYDFNGNIITPAPTAPTDLSSQLKDLLATQNTNSTAQGDLYQKTYGVTPAQAQADKLTAQNDLNTQNAAVQAAQERYNALNSQITGLDYQQNTVIPNQDQANATGKGETAAGLAPITAAQQRTILLQKAPLQFQALLAQSDLAAAQGKATLAAGILQQANAHLDALFNAQSQDIKNNVATQNANFDKIWNYATTAEQNQIAQMKADTAANTTQANAFINDVQAAIKEATTNGSPDIAGQMAKLATISLDPTSKTFKTDYAKVNAQLVALQAQVKPKRDTSVTEIDGRKVLVDNQTGATVKDLGKATSSSSGYSITPTLKTKLLGAGNAIDNINQLQSDIAAHGAQYVLDNGNMDAATQQVIEDEFGISKTPAADSNKGIFGWGFAGL